MSVEDYCSQNPETLGCPDPCDDVSCPSISCTTGYTTGYENEGDCCETCIALTGSCDDGNPCTSGDVWDSGTCAGTSVVCDYICDSQTGLCVDENDPVGCDFNGTSVAHGWSGNGTGTNYCNTCACNRPSWLMSDASYSPWEIQAPCALD